MKKISIAFLSVCLIALIAGTASAREVNKTDRRVVRDWSDEVFTDPALLEAGVRDLYQSAQVDTYCLVWFDFAMMNWQGWTQRDYTAQVDTFCHVEDFSGISPGQWGYLDAIEGSKSIWCGTRDWESQILVPYPCPGDFEYLCAWECAPGYGNGWNQMLVTDAFSFSGLLSLSYHGIFDSEPGYDQTAVEYDNGDGDWREIALYDGWVDTIAVHELHLNKESTKLRFHFVSDGAWSDEDGLWCTDGAFIVDSITIADDGGVIDFDNFESYTVCIRDTRDAGGIWYGDVEESFGIYSGLANNLGDKDPCYDNFGTQIVFFIGSEYPSADYPGLYDTPYCKGPGSIEDPCQQEYVISPVIDMNMYSSNCDENQDTPIPPAVIPDLGGAYLRFTVYRDLPVENLVFYDWGVRNIDPIDGCPGSWLDRGFGYYGPDKDYFFTTQNVSDLVGVDTNGDGQADPIQIRLGIIDMCDSWYQEYGNCAKHTPAPWYDNVRFYRFSTAGPQWSYRDLDLFQDNFPEEEFDLESFIRADCANDLRSNDDPVIDPGDSAVVTVSSPLGGGIDTTFDGWPKVYCHVYAEYIGDPLTPKPTLYGPGLAGTYGRYDSDDGSTWTILQCDYARTPGGNIVPDRYMIDMNDSLFTRGYRVNYYFAASDVAGHFSTLPINAGEGAYFEWTCLPTMSSDILFVDDFHGRGTMRGTVEQYWNPSFKAVLPDANQPDRYDVNNPSSAVSNGPGSRAKNYHMTTAYRKVIWDSGNLDFCTISEGSSYSDKSDDCQMLIDWMEFSPHDVGLWICGDDVAADLDGAPAGCPLVLMSTYCGVQLRGDSYYELSGIVSPLVEAHPTPGNPLWHIMWGDSFYVFGGCPIINQFDYLEKTAGGLYALRYPEVDGLPYYAGIYNIGINDGGYAIKTMWFGFSFMYIRDAEVGVPIMRNQVVADIISWMENDINSNITEADEVPQATTLSQNFPNPFNPTTTIKFGLRAKAHVTLKIYDVAGRLVRTLVNEVRNAGRYEVAWDGVNNIGNKAASGVYFYRMSTTEFERTRKMVLLR